MITKFSTISSLGSGIKLLLDSKSVEDMVTLK